MKKVKIGTCIKGNELLTQLPEIIGDSGFRISSIGLYCNPLQYEERKKELEYCIENAHMYGHWYLPTCNIGFCPRSWEMMFDAVDSDYLGLEWEPSHQLEQLINPIEQLKTWSSKIVHVHGKDAAVDWNHIKKNGAWFGEKYCVHRFPGLGECDWSEIISILLNSGYTGDICIEGFHDPVFNRNREMEGQINALHYLKDCRNRE